MASLDDLMRRGYTPERLAEKATRAGDTDLLRQLDRRARQQQRDADRAAREQKNALAQAEREQRNSKREQDQQNKADATNLKNQAIAWFTTPDGRHIPITAPSGGTMREYDKSGVLWDSNTGKPYKLENGQLRDASEDGSIITKDGSVYRVDKGQPWKWIGYDKGNIQPDKSLTSDLARETQRLNEIASAATGIENAITRDIASDRKRLKEIDDEMFSADESTRAALTKEKEALTAGISAKEERQAQAELASYRAQTDKLAWSEEKARLIKENTDAKRELAVDPKGFPNTGRLPDASSQSGIGSIPQQSREATAFDPMGDFTERTLRAFDEQTVRIAGNMVDYTRQVVDAMSQPDVVGAWTKSAMAPKLAQDFADRSYVPIKLPEATAKATGLTHAPESWFTPEAMERQLTAKLAGQDKVKLPTGYSVDGGTIYAPQDEPVKLFGVQLPWLKTSKDVPVGHIVYDDFGVGSIQMNQDAKISPSFLSQDYYHGLPEYASPSKQFEDSFTKAPAIGSQVVDEVRKEAMAAFDAQGTAEEAWKSRRWSAEDTRDFLNQWQTANDAQRAELIAQIDPRQASLKSTDRKLDGKFLYDNGFVSAQDARLINKTAYGQDPALAPISTTFDEWLKSGTSEQAVNARRAYAAVKDRKPGFWETLASASSILLPAAESLRQNSAVTQQAKQAFLTEYYQQNASRVDFSLPAFTAARDKFLGTQNPVTWAINGLNSSLQTAAASSAGMMLVQAPKLILDGIYTKLAGAEWLPQGMRDNYRNATLTDEEKTLIGQQTFSALRNMSRAVEDRLPTSLAESLQLAMPASLLFNSSLREKIWSGQKGAELNSALSELRTTIDSGNLTQESLERISARINSAATAFHDKEDGQGNLTSQILGSACRMEWENNLLDPRSAMSRSLSAYLQTMDPSYWSQVENGALNSAFENEIQKRASDYASQNGAVSETSFLGPLQTSFRGAQVAPLTETAVEIGSELLGFGVGKALTVGKWMARSERLGLTLNRAGRVIGSLDGLEEKLFELGKVKAPIGGALTSLQKARNIGVDLLKQGWASGFGEGLEEVVGGFGQAGATFGDALAQGVQGAIGGVGLGAVHYPVGAAMGGIQIAAMKAADSMALNKFVADWNKRYSETPVTKEQVVQAQAYQNTELVQTLRSKLSDIFTRQQEVNKQIAALPDRVITPTGKGTIAYSPDPRAVALSQEQDQLHAEYAATMADIWGITENSIAAVQEINGLPDNWRSITDAAVKVANGTPISNEQQQILLNGKTENGKSSAYIAGDRIVLSDAMRAEIAKAAPTTAKIYFTKTESEQLAEAQNSQKGGVENGKTQKRQVQGGRQEVLTTQADAPAGQPGGASTSSTPSTNLESAGAVGNPGGETASQTPMPTAPAPSPSSRYSFDVTYLPIGAGTPITVTHRITAVSPEIAATKRDAILLGVRRLGTVQSVTDLQPMEAKPLQTDAPPQNNAFVPAANTSEWTSGAIRSAISNAAAAFGYKIVDTGIDVGIRSHYGGGEQVVNLGTQLYDKLNPGSEIGQWIDAMAKPGTKLFNEIGSKAIENAAAPGLHRVWFGHDFATNLPAIVDKFGWAGVPDYIGQLLKDSLTKSGIPFPGVQLLVQSGAVSDKVATAWLSTNIGEVFGGGVAFFGTYRLALAAKRGNITKPRFVFATLGMGIKVGVGLATAQPFLVLSGLADAAILVTSIGQIKAAFKKGQDLAKTSPAPAVVEENTVKPAQQKQEATPSTGPPSKATGKESLTVQQPETNGTNGTDGKNAAPKATEGASEAKTVLSIPSKNRVPILEIQTRKLANGRFQSKYQISTQNAGMGTPFFDNQTYATEQQAIDQAKADVSEYVNRTIGRSDTTAAEKAQLEKIREAVTGLGKLPEAVTKKAPASKPAKPAKAPKKKPAKNSYEKKLEDRAAEFAKQAKDATTEKLIETLNTLGDVPAFPADGIDLMRKQAIEAELASRGQLTKPSAKTPTPAPQPTAASTVPEYFQGQMNSGKTFTAISQLAPWMFNKNSPFKNLPRVFMSPDRLQVSETKQDGWTPGGIAMAAYNGRILVDFAELVKQLNATPEGDRQAWFEAAIDEELEHYAQQQALNAAELTALWNDAPDTAKQFVVETYHSADVLAAGGDWRKVALNPASISQEFLRIYRQALKRGATTEQATLRSDVDAYAAVNPAFGARLAKALGDIARWMREELTGLLTGDARARFDDAIARIDAKRKEIEATIKDESSPSPQQQGAPADQAGADTQANRPTGPPVEDPAGQPEGIIDPKTASIEQIDQLIQNETAAATEESRGTADEGVSVSDLPAIKALRDIRDVLELLARKNPVITQEVGQNMIDALAEKYQKWKTKSQDTTAAFSDIEDPELRAALEQFDAVLPAAASKPVATSPPAAAKASDPAFISAAAQLSDVLWSKGYDTPQKFAAFLHSRFADRITPKVLSQVWSLGANTDPDVAVNWSNVHAEAIRPTVDPQAHESAASPKNDLEHPTEAQKEAGNFKKGHVVISGLDISVEQPAGSIRSGADSNGKPWSRQLKSHYGYIKRTTGADGENLDVFIKPGTPLDWKGPVFVVNQVDANGKFDEHKPVIGAADEAEARELYLENYANGWKGIGSVASMPFDDFTAWSQDGDLTGPAETWNIFPESSGTLGIPRADMPQVKIPDRAELLTYLSDRGVRLTETTIRFAKDSLFPSQAEYSTSKSTRAKELLDTDRHVFISADNYIVDGHHQFVAAGNGPLKVVRIGLPIREAIRAVADFPKAKGGERFKAMSDADALEFEHFTEAQHQEVAKHRKGLDALRDKFQTVWEPWYEGYKASAPDFAQMMRSAAAKLGHTEETGMFKLRTNPKGIKRIVEKAYYDGGVVSGKTTMADALADIKDVLAATFVVETPAQVEQTISAIEESTGVKRDQFNIKDTIESGSPFGYRDIKLRIPIKPGQWAEVILITPSMMAAKNAAGHPWYELGRGIESLKAEAGGVLPESMIPLEQLITEKAKEIYGAAWAEDMRAMSALNLSASANVDAASSYDQSLSTYGEAQAPSEYSPTTGEPSSKLTNDSQSGSPTATASPGNLESLTSQNVEPGLMSDAGITVKENTVPGAERQPETNETWRSPKLGEGDKLKGQPVRVAGSGYRLGTLVKTEFRDYDGPGSGLYVFTSNGGPATPASNVEVLIPSEQKSTTSGADLPPNVSQRDMAGLRSRERIALERGVDPQVVSALMDIDRIGRVGAKKTIGQINDLIAKREKELKGTGVEKINVSSGTTGPLSDVIKRIEQVRERPESLKATDALLYALMDLSGKSGMTQKARTFLESAVRALYQQQPALADVLDEIISQNPVASSPLPARDSLLPTTTPQSRAADAILEYIRNGNDLDWRELFAITDKAWGGTQADGTYTVKDAYDALELAINLHILKDGFLYATNDAEGFAGLARLRMNLGALSKMLSLIPTQSKRTKEQDDMQQFSTPPHFGYIANWVAAVHPGDVVLEPSAGIGGLAVFAKNDGATVIVNELSERRRAFLKELGFDHVTGENAEQLHAIYAPQIAAGTLPQPTVVVMNPPFSNAAKSGKKGKTIIGANHVEEGLKLLPAGGRLVAIVGEGMAIDAHHFRAWWKNIASKYNVRANILVDGKNYAKYGTTFSNRLLVIDKTGPTADLSQIVGGQVDEISQLPTLLEDIRNDRTRNTSAQPAGDPASQPGGRAAASGNPAGPTTGETGNPGGPGGQPGGAVDSGLGGTPSASGEGTTGRPSGEPAGGSTGNPASPQAVGSEPGSQVTKYRVITADGVTRVENLFDRADAEHELKRFPGGRIEEYQGPLGTKPWTPSSDPAQMSPEQAVSAFEFVRQKGQRTLMLRHGNTIHTFKQQKNGKLTAPKEEIIRGIHKALVTQRVEMLTRDRADASEGSVASTKNLARESLQKPARYNVSAAAVDAYGITLPEGYVRNGDLYVLPGATPAVASQETSGITITTADNANREIENEDDVFSLYKPAKLHIPGAQKHLAPLVESSAMASVTPPDPTYTPNLPKEVITEGRISETSLENIVYAGQAHKQILPNGERRGYLIGDGTGVGKGRQIAGVIMDNMRQGRTKAVWISEKEGLMDDAKRDAEDIGLDPASITFLGKTKKGAKIDKADGIIFSTYSTLKGGHDGILGPVKDWWAKIRGKNESRIQQLVNWLGKDFDGVIAFDEAHNAGNAIAMQGKRGVKKPSATGIAVVDLQTALPKARILYVSATAATEVENLSYADRLGIWGMGTPFPNKLDFFNKIRAGGISAMEIVARDLKAQGLYLARSISYKGVEFSRLTQELTPEQTGLYNTIAKAWQTVLSNVDQTMGESGANNNAMARSAALSAFWGAQQRFFNQLLTAMELPAVLTDMDAELAKGNSLVLQIVNTNEATQNRQIAQKQTEAGADKADIEDLDLSPRDILLQYLDKSFPTTKFEQVQDPNNPDRTVWQPARDSAGNIIQDPAAVATKLRLMDELALLDVPGSPLDQIIAKFGEESVAEVTGRTQRVVSVKKDDGTRKTQIQRRGPSHRKVEAKEFQDGKRRILIFSDAGGTGFSFHASNRAKNKQRRVHYLVQAGWRADKALQGFGRTHRTDQASAPIYKLAETNIAGHKRFISTIARRLSQLGALTTGERKSKGSGLFSETDNLESEYAEEALTRLIYDLHASRVANYTFDQFSAGLGFNKTITDDGGNLVTRSVMVEPTTGQLIEDKIPAIPQFLNRVLALPLDEQNLVFDLFMSRLESRIKNAMDDGTYDPGTQSYKAEQLNKISDEVVFSQKGTGSKTRIVEIEAVDPIEFTSFDDIPRLGSSPVVQYVRNRKSGRLYALKEAQKETDQSGAMVETFRRIGSHTFDKVRASEITTGGTMVRAKVGDEITLEDGRKWKLTQLPSLSNPYLQVLGDITGTDGKVAKAQSLDPNTWSNTAGLEILAKQGGLYVQGANHDADYVDPQGHYEEIPAEDVPALWQAEIDGAEKYSRKKVNFLVGAMLPVWDRIQLEHPKVYRFTTSEGEPMLGVLLPPRDVPGIRQRMGAKNTLGPQEVFDMARNDGGTFGLANGWSFRRVLVSGEHRIELSGLNYQQSDLFVNQMGGQMERIAFKPRHFIPTVEVMEKVLAQSPVITLNGQDIGNIPPPAAARRGISAQETPLIAFAKPAVANPAAMARFNDNLALATWFADKYRNIRGVEFEDLLQESRIGLWKAADRFEADRGIPFGAYASAVIRNRLNELYNRNNRHVIDQMTTLDAPIGDSADSATAADSVAARVDMLARPEDVAAINEEVANLPAKPRRIWEDFLAGMNWREIGTKYGMSHEGARKIALATGNTLRAALKKHGITTVDDVFPQKDAFNLERLPERKSQIEDEENWSYDTTATIPEETPDGVTEEDVAPAAAAKPRIDISAPAAILATNAGDRSTGMGQSDNAGESQGGENVSGGNQVPGSPQGTADAYVAWMGQKATDRAAARLLSDPEKAFIAFANETGRVLPESWLKEIKPHQIKGGEEHWVYDRGDGRITKILKPEKGYPIGGDPLEYVMRIGRMNAAAPQLDIRVEGILPSKKSARIVTSMKKVQGEHPTVEFLRTWLNEHGWTEVGAHGWLHEASGVEMGDAAPDNFIQVDNDVVPIDVWFTGDVTKPMFLPTPPAAARSVAMPDSPAPSNGPDARYLELAKDPVANLAELQSMVDTAAKDAGYTIGPVWHGGADGFTEFKEGMGTGSSAGGDGFFFSTVERIAKGYAAKRKNGRVLRAALKSPDHLTIKGSGSWGQYWLDQAAAEASGLDLRGYRDEMHRDTSTATKGWWDHDARKYRNFPSFISIPNLTWLLKDKRFSGVTIENLSDAARKRDVEVNQNTVVVFNPTQIKSADPVTRDASGNVIPLSQRFNPGTPLIAFAKPSAKAELELSKIEEEGQRARAYREDAKKAAVSNNGIGAQEFWKTHLSGRLDKLDFYAPGAKAAILDDRHEEALVAATINAMMDTMRQDIQKAFGYPKFWQKHNSRLQQFLDEILPTAARLEVSHLDDEGNFVFKDFQMRAGIIPFGKARVLDLKPGQKFMDNGELFTVGELVEGKGFVLLRDMLAEDQQVIFDAFHDKFPESAHYLDRFIMPGMEEARYMGPQGTMTAEFNRHALRALFNDWPQELRDLFGPMPLPDMPYVEGYTPDVAEQKTLVAMIGSMLRKFKSGARKFKAGEARESGNIKNLFDGFSIRAMEAHREKIRVQTRQKLIEAAAVPDSSIPAAEKEKYVPIDSTFAKLMESIKRAQRLDKSAFPALTEALSPADQRMMARILGDAYRLKGRGLMIHKEVERELMLGAARQVTSNALTKILAGLLERYNSGLLATPFTAITNWASNEVMKSMRVANRFNYAMLSALTGDLRGAKLGAYETGFLLRGFITDRFPQWQRQRIGQIVPRELFDDQTGLEAMDIDPNKSVWEQLQRLNLGGAFLKAVQYGEIDIRQKQQLAYAAYRAHAEIAADEAGVKGSGRRPWMREWMKNAPAEIHRDVYMSTVLYMMDYQNVPAWLDPSQSNSAISQVIKRAIIPFAKWPYNMARQFKRFSMDSAFDLVMPGSTKEQRINGAANLMVMAGLTALGAWLVGSDDDDDKLLGSNVDAEGKLLEAAFRTGNRINVSRLARIIFAHGLMRGATFSTTDAGGREEDLWWRYRNYPYFKEGILMGLAANGKWGEFGTAFSDISGEYMSLGLIAKVLGLSSFDKDKPVPYRTTEALYDVATSGALPSPWRQLAVKVADPVMRRSTPSESTGYGATALDAIKANTPGLSRSVPSVGQRKQVAFAPFNAQEWFRRESGDVSRDSTLSPQEKAATISDLRQQAEKLSLPALTQRDIFRDAGLPVDKMSMSTTSNAPAASDIQALRRMGVGPESYGITTNAAGQTRLTYPSPGTVRITKPGMEALRFFGGVNLMAAPRVKKQPLTAKDMFPDGGK